MNHKGITENIPARDHNKGVKMKSRILLLLFGLIMLSGAADAATTIFFDSSQTATLVETGVTSDTISSNGYLFTYTRDNFFSGGTPPLRYMGHDGAV